jgi:hypothetical protein
MEPDGSLASTRGQNRFLPQDRWANDAFLPNFFLYLQIQNMQLFIVYQRSLASAHLREILSICKKGILSNRTV